jgi:hypothetical protein
MPRKLKVFRTAIGFHDAYVATPSRKAALAAWGADADLFARGVAEEVADARLMREPLAHPGEVIRVSRGGLSEHLKALPKKKRTRIASRDAKEAPAGKQAKPPPGRDKVEAAEEALAAAHRTHEAEAAKLEREREAIGCKLDALRSKQAKERARLERRRDAAREAYRKALDRWSDEA